jgi:hypothetical protein
MTTRYAQERSISAEAAKRIGILLDSITRILEREQEDAQREANKANEGIAVFPRLPPDLRWRVMVLGSSVEDLNFWIRRDDQDGGRWYTLTEVESGYEVGGVDAREACENYFKNDVMDTRGNDE